MTEAIVTPTDLAELAELIPRLNVKNPKPADMAALRRVLVRPELARHLGDIRRYATDALFQSMTAGPAAVEIMQYQYEQARDGLGYKTASPLEQMLIDTVTLCWIRYQDTERRYSGLDRENLTIVQADYWERRVTACQRRYLRAVETLARVRRLSVAMLQVNIGQQQVNQVVAKKR